MSAILSRIRKNSTSKHEKLCEEASGNSEAANLNEGVPFHVKYLGSVLVEKSSGEDVTSDAIKTIILMAKKQKQVPRVTLTIALKGIKMEDPSTTEVLLEVSIYRISYCSADATYTHVFAFISTNSNDTLECHAFLCPKKKIAQAATLTIAQAFNLAYECWQASQARRKRRRLKRDDSCCTSRDDSCSSRGCKDEGRSRRDGSRAMRDGSRDRDRDSSRLTRHRIQNNNNCDDKDKQVTVAIIENYNSVGDEKTTSPSSGYNSCSSNQEDETLLIDLSSPGDELGGQDKIILVQPTNNVKSECDKPAEVERDRTKAEEDKVVNEAGHWVRFEDEDNMDRSFKILSEERSPAMLRRLPPAAQGLEFGALAGSPGMRSYLDSPFGSPGQGCTLSQLPTPVGSPLHTSQLVSGSPYSYGNNNPPVRLGGTQPLHVPGSRLGGPGTPQRLSSSPALRHELYSSSAVPISSRSLMSPPATLSPTPVVSPQHHQLATSPLATHSMDARSPGSSSGKFGSLATFPTHQ